jgi:transglutaminase-like putative cysteine protease
MKLRVVHETAYDYDEPVTTSHHEVHISPRDDAGGQVCLHHDIVISPTPAVMRARSDYFDNRTCYFGIHESHRALRVVAESVVEVGLRHASSAPPCTPWEQVRDRVARDRSREVLRAYGFTFDSPFVRATPELAELARPSFEPGRPLHEAMINLTTRIFTDFKYDPTATQVSTPLSEVMRHRRGVCQDFAHLEIGCLRAMGLPARYVSGYLLTRPPPGKSRLVGADASHAWISTFLPEYGWLDFDPANNVQPTDKHVVVAHGRDFSDVTPVRGVILGGGRHQLRVSVDVIEVESAPAAPA